MENIFTKDFKAQPYWWDASPLHADDGASPPASVDVCIVGAGYTGLHAAIETARAGFSTVVVDAEQLGFGCSTRNGGQISTSVKLSLDALTRRFGAQRARALVDEGQASLEHVTQFIQNEDIDCDFKVTGRFHGAHSKAAFTKLAKLVQLPADVRGKEARLVTESQLPDELGTRAYVGGVVFPHHASLDPGKYHAGLCAIARQAGATLVGNCRVTGINRVGTDFAVSTLKSEISAHKVVVATNGYTSELTPTLKRRVIPIGSYVIATDVIDSALMDRIMPTQRILSDTRKLVYYYRPSPDRKRIVFGGRVSLRETNARVSARRLRNELVRLFPELSHTRISHSWSGTVGYTFDTLMHCGNDRGLYHAMGYCGSGVGMAGYLGNRIGQSIANPDWEESAFSKIPFPTRPLYTGNPWFLAPSVLGYRILDRFS